MCSVLINILVSGELITYNDTLDVELKVLSSKLNKFNTITKTSNENLQYSVNYVHTAMYMMDLSSISSPIPTLGACTCVLDLAVTS